MHIYKPVDAEEHLTFRCESLEAMIDALGTPSFGTACLRAIEQTLDAEHWTLFRQCSNDSVTCLAEASRVRGTIARENISRFIKGLHRVDPVMVAARRPRSESTLIIALRAQDIPDCQYRECFELAHARERLTYILRHGCDTYFTSVYRGARRHNYSLSEMRRYAPLARFIVSTASKHQTLLSAESARTGHLDADGIERVLMILSASLSKRERDVCLMAAAGRTIERTAAELQLSTTSVITYRQRAYRKLGINRQIQLMAMVTNLHSTLVASKTGFTEHKAVGRG